LGRPNGHAALGAKQENQRIIEITQQKTAVPG
jgi:hypothetical protein